MSDRPNKDASRADWDDYAKYLGLNPDEYPNKDALIEAADAAEKDLDDLAGPDPDAEGHYDDAVTREDLGVQEAGVNAQALGESEPPEVTPGKAGKYPDGYEDATDSWKAAYDHAVKAGNPEKTAIVWADIHHDNEEFSA